MSLSNDDLQAVRTIHREENAPLEDRVMALHNDVKEIYYMMAKIERTKEPSKKFLKLDLEAKIKSVYADLQVTAKEAGITLPR